MVVEGIGTGREGMVMVAGVGIIWATKGIGREMIATSSMTGIGPRGSVGVNPKEARARGRENVYISLVKRASDC
jgi:hypothetical protein